MTVIGGDDIVRGLEAQLRANVPAVITLLGLTDLGEIQTWQIVPDVDAIAAAKLPAIAIVSPRVSAQPQRSNSEYSAEWQVSVGVFARGDDHEHTQTQIQQWAKVVRASALMTPSLPGTKIRIRWAGEEYDLLPNKKDARTIAGAEVMFDASVEKAIDLTALRNDPLLISVHPDVQPN
ncbi:hypothetical protein [Microbacterium karelineae]|uniref:hypothetical protein n=1 Tax=Microbacterium karelineae TaxID=2654283 RepID=UPI0012EA9796|nr:hypothetical protein [Microbacterium karelineae]